jgi:simple sugar transport system ATP-binding protein
MPGTIHGVIGENGAGKSTAMKMLYGIYPPDSGEILIRGNRCEWKTPSDAIRAGIGMVHQHFMLAGPMSALDNILLGTEPLISSLPPKAFTPIDRNVAREKLERLCKSYGLSVDLDAAIETLPVGVQQRIEILKLLYRDAQILILDEPTAVLTPQEITDLFENLRRLRNEGKTILIITHKLREVMSLTDEVTIFRAGKVVGEVKTSETTPQGLAEKMVGRKVSLRVDAPPPPVLRGTALEVRDLTLGPKPGAKSEKNRLSRISFHVAKGEVVGIAGVEGNGQSELLQALLHPADPSCRSSGEIKILGKDVSSFETVEIKDLGVGVIPEDRQREGLLMERPVSENFLLGLQRKAEFRKFGFLSLSSLNRSAQSALEEYDVRPRSLIAIAGRLSGGNQQKLIIAREFARAPKLLIAAQPTRGVDIGAIEFIHKRILKAREDGAGVLLVSSELDEILALSDRILVMYEGKIVASFERGRCDEKVLGLRMGGGEVEASLA